MEETRDREKLRLKLKIGSFFSKLFWTTQSVNKVMRRKASPKSSPVKCEAVRRLRRRNVVIPPTPFTSR